MITLAPESPIALLYMVEMIITNVYGVFETTVYRVIQNI